MNFAPPSPIRRSLASLCLCAAVCLLASASPAAPLLQTTAVQTQPDPSAPVLTFLKAGSEPVPDAAALASAPAGWTAIDVAGPFEGYVQNKDLTKGLEVRPGTPIHLAPKPDSGVLATAAKGDKISITGLRGRWTQVRLEKTLVAYIHLGPEPASSAADLSGAAPARADQNPPAPSPAPGPVDLSTPAPAASGHAADVGSGGGNGALPRFFEGKFASSRRLLRPRRPYDWEIDDASGSRIAYLDLSKLLLTEQIASYAGHNVEVFGAVNPVPSSRDIVIVVESLQLK